MDTMMINVRIYRLLLILFVLLGQWQHIRYVLCVNRMALGFMSIRAFLCVQCLKQCNARAMLMQCNARAMLMQAAVLQLMPAAVLQHCYIFVY